MSKHVYPVKSWFKIENHLSNRIENENVREPVWPQHVRVADRLGAKRQLAVARRMWGPA